MPQPCNSVPYLNSAPPPPSSPPAAVQILAEGEESWQHTPIYWQGCSAGSLHGTVTLNRSLTCKIGLSIPGLAWMSSSPAPKLVYQWVL